MEVHAHTHLVDSATATTTVITILIRKKLIMRKFILAFLFPISLFAQKGKADLLRQFMTGQHDYYGFNGNVLIAENGKAIYKQSLGYADFDSKKMLDENSVFELASVSKQFTALGIIFCRENGLLNYNEKVKKYLPDFPYGNISILHLLMHTSGLPEYEEQFAKNWDHKKIAYNQDVVDMLLKVHDTLFFTPGTSWKYSNTGYALLALIIEKVSQMSFGSFLKKNIFDPLNMSRTFVYNTRRSTNKIPSNYALGFVYSNDLKKYILPDKDPKLDYVIYLDGIVGDGCVNSTTGDLLKWENYLLENQKLPLIKEMLSPLIRTSANDTLNYYGFGQFIQPYSDHGRIISHTGGWPGYSTFLEHREKPDETLIVLSNNEKASGQIRVALESILNGEELVMPYQHKEMKIDPVLLDRYTGKYSAFLTLVFIKKDDKLWRHREGTPDIELKPESETKFFYGDGTDRQVEFELDATGKVTKAWFINTGQKGEFKKIQ